ncbi:phosphoglycerate kinase [uncultured Sphaerochaeta sp.]|uniref:phosphoglycerate kinase n=1 Tax=uncultured Sphaerochaeta sp. TaxID=886478 RepID=UPI002A0A0EE9|nr:phosphoglycerate kinase [uncultured Sphaerochaeta sp.]
MEKVTSIRMRSLEDVVLKGRTVIFRPDINSPIDPKTKRIVNTNRLEKAAPTLKALLDGGAKVALIAHQGDTLDYQNLIPLAEHAQILSKFTGYEVAYLDDVCGPAAQERVRSLKEGQAVVLGNLRYLSEEITAFEKEVKLKPSQMLDTWLIRSLAPLADLYVNDAFAAAHRNAPSMVAFQELLPTAGGKQLVAEYTALSKVAAQPIHPCVFVLGGGKISDAFGMMRNVLENKTADAILCGGITALVMLLAKGVSLGDATWNFLKDRDLLMFVEQAKSLLESWSEAFVTPLDLAYEEGGKRLEATVETIAHSKNLQTKLFPDLGEKTIKRYKELIAEAGSVFVNGPAGVYEDERFEKATKEIWTAIANADGYTVVGGGDTITAATRFTDIGQYSYVCTAGGAMVRFLSGKKLPLIEAMEKAWERDSKE